MKPLIAHARLRRYGEDGFAVSPAVFFTPARRAVFKKAAAGGRFEWKTKRWILTPDKVHAVVRNLRSAGFNVLVDDDALEAYERREVERVEELAVVRRRLRLLDDAFRQSGRSLYPFQVTGSEWLAQRDRAHLGDDMGLGKTIQVIAALPNDAPVVVVCPASIKGVWAREFLRWRPSFKVSVLSGREAFYWPRQSEVVVINYDILPDVHGPDCPDRAPAEDLDPFAPESLAPKAPPCRGCLPLLQECADKTVVVFDEAHKLRGDKTQRTERARAIARGARQKEGRTWLSTGTPLVNRAPELWNLYEAADLAREAFGSYTEFLRLFGGTRKILGNGKFAGITWGKPLPEAAERIASVSLRRLKQDVLQELPPRTWRVVPVELSKRDLSYIDEELQASGLTVESVVQAIEDGRTLGFQKLAAARAALAAAKTRVLVDYVREEFEEQDEPVVVFSAHRAPIDHLAKRAGWGVISGDVSAKKRTQTEDAFQRGELKGVALTIGAGSEGITLTRASNIVFVDRDWTPAANKQAEDRIHRIGQRFPCFYTDLVSAHPLDVRVTEILQGKARLIAETVDAAAALGGGS
jgi:SWI/SNF-related matrix-associated actin-dependent regulator of chromatin subfamily A-like protein 1